MYAAFEKAGEDLNVGNSGCDIVFTESQAAMDEFNVAQQNQERVRQKLYDAQEGHAMALVELQEKMSKVNDGQEVVVMKCRDLKDSGAKFNEADRKADDAHDQVKAHRERCHRLSVVYGTAEEDPNEALGLMGQLTRDTAGATHALTCGTTDRYCNEVTYLQEALEMIEKFHRRDTRREVAEIMLVERPR